MKLITEGSRTKAAVVQENIDMFRVVYQKTVSGLGLLLQVIKTLSNVCF